jgi:hypothetical protein
MYLPRSASPAPDGPAAAPVNAGARDAVKRSTMPMRGLALPQPEEAKGTLRVNVEKPGPDYADHANRVVAK